MTTLSFKYEDGKQLVIPTGDIIRLHEASISGNDQGYSGWIELEDGRILIVNDTAPSCPPTGRACDFAIRSSLDPRNLRATFGFAPAKRLAGDPAQTILYFRTCLHLNMQNVKRSRV